MSINVPEPIVVLGGKGACYTANPFVQQMLETAGWELRWRNHETALYWSRGKPEPLHHCGVCNEPIHLESMADLGVLGMVHRTCCVRLQLSHMSNH